MKPLSAPSVEPGGDEKSKLVRILEKNSNQRKGWIFVISSKNLPQDFQAMLEAKGQVHLSHANCRQLLEEFHPLQLPAFGDHGAPVKYFIYNHSGEQLNLSNIKKFQQKFLKEMDNFNMFLLPMDPDLLDVLDSLNFDMGTVSSSSRGAYEDDIIGSGSRPVGFLMTRSHWKTLIGCVTSFQEKCGIWIKKRKKQSGSDTNNNCQQSSRLSKPALLKWITHQKRTSPDHEFADDEDTDGVERNRKFIKFGRKAHRHTRYGSSCRVGSKAKRIINLPEGKRKFVKMQETRGDKETMEEEKDKQLIRIELKPDPMIQESSFQFCSGDLLRLRVTIQEGFNSGLQGNIMLAEGYVDYEMEIDFVQHLMCETRGVGGCKNRRITKLLKRTVISELDWERGIKMTGQQFALSWIPYRIPHFSEDDQFEPEHERGLGRLDDRFKLAGREHELQIRFYQKDEEESQYILCACSFTLNLMEEHRNHSSGDQTLSCFGDSGDILQIFQDVDESSLDELNIDLDTAAGVDMLMIKSLSVTEELNV